MILYASFTRLMRQKSSHPKLGPFRDECNESHVKNLLKFPISIKLLKYLNDYPSSPHPNKLEKKFHGKSIECTSLSLAIQLTTQRSFSSTIFPINWYSRNQQAQRLNYQAQVSMQIISKEDIPDSEQCGPFISQNDQKVQDHQCGATQRLFSSNVSQQHDGRTL